MQFTACHNGKRAAIVLAMKHTEWLENITGGDAVNAVAKTAGIVPRTFARQVERDHIDAENVIAIALAYGHHPVGALVDTEYLDEKWATQVDPTHALQQVTEEQLANEVLRRMKIGQANGALNTPIDELTTNNVHPLHPDMPDDAVADSSPEVGGTPDDYER